MGGRRARRAPLPSRDTGTELTVVTGLSGAGKSQAIRALEDLGYFCVDNLPTTLMPTLAELSRRAGDEISRVAVVVDVREGAFLAEFPRIYRQLGAMRGVRPQLIFLEASDAALLRRFSETRRPHPLAPDRPVAEGIREERARLKPIRRMTDRIIDTSDLTVHDLRRAVMTMSHPLRAGVRLVVTLVSFGFKYGLPLDSDLVFDVRFLPNPHFVRSLKPRTGRDRAVVRYLEGFAETREFLARAADLLLFLVPRYVSEGKSYLTIAIGCTGGRHRSVAIAAALGRRLAALKGIQVRVRHRDIAER